MKKISKKLNKKRLIIELIILGAIVFGVVLWRFLPWLFIQPISAPEDPYASYRNLYETVVTYDFSRGPSKELESRLDHAMRGNSSPIQLYYNLKARIEYNYRLGNYEEALKDLEEAKNYIPVTAEQEYIDKMSEELSKTS